MDLDFEINDDPWIEHKKHSPKCEFVKLDKQDELMWTLKDAVMLAIRCATNEKYQEVKDVIRQLDNQEKGMVEGSFSREVASKMLLELRDGSKYLTYSQRLESFGNLGFDDKRKITCTSKTVC